MKRLSADATLASVVFFKMHDFARKPVSEQARLRAQLEAVVAVTAASLAPADRIVLDAADGAVVVVFGDPGRALRLAEQALAATVAGLPLCVGVNHGAVQMAGAHSADGMIGDGIAVAACIAEFAAPPGLLISRSFKDAMADAAPGSEAGLFPAGTFADAGLRTHELFGLDGLSAARREKRLSVVAVVAAIGLLGAGIAVRVSAEGHDQFLDATLGQFRVTAAQGEQYLRDWFAGLPWQKN